MPYSCISGATPVDGNPLLWALKAELKAFVDCLLTKPRYAEVAGQYADSRNPMASRLAYILFHTEDQCLTECLDRLQGRMPGQLHIMTYMFDGAVVCLRGEGTAERLQESLDSINSTSPVQMVVKQW